MVVAGEGNYLTVEDANTGERRRVFDAIGGAAVSALGHGDKEIEEAMAKAAKESSYTYLAYITNYHAEELAKFYIDKSPKGAFAAALFTCSGSESNENGIKTVRQYWLEKGQPQRTKILGRKQSYHGYTIGAMSLSSNIKQIPFKDIMLPAEQYPKVNPCYPYRFQHKDETEEQYVERLLEELEETIIANDPNTIGAFIFEPLGGSSFGTQPALPGYLSGIRKVLDKYGILLWLDEVMCGTGRASATGGLNCWESWPDFDGPDMQSIGKTLGAGYVTIAGLLVSPKVQKVFTEASNLIVGGQTYHQHGFNCKVALEVQKKIDRLGLRKNAFEMGNLLGKRLQELAPTTKTIGQVRGLGVFWSVELVKDRSTKESFPAELGLGGKVTAKMFQNGMTSMGMTGTAGDGSGDHVTLAPPFNITAEDVELMAQTLIKSVREVEEELDWPTQFADPKLINTESAAPRATLVK